jgi:hypothetical protein
MKKLRPERWSQSDVSREEKHREDPAMATRPHARKTARAKTARAKTARARTISSHTRRTARRAGGARKWSGRVTRESDALDLEGGVFKLTSPKRIAASLKRSAERSKRRKADPYRSALSMLTFYINRAGRNLSASRKRTLNKAKEELRAQFARTSGHFPQQKSRVR